jgi:hypothetical protein
MAAFSSSAFRIEWRRRVGFECCCLADTSASQKIPNILVDVHK